MAFVLPYSFDEIEIEMEMEMEWTFSSEQVSVVVLLRRSPPTCAALVLAIEA
jgi:hypothetical protein